MLSPDFRDLQICILISLVEKTGLNHGNSIENRAFELMAGLLYRSRFGLMVCIRLRVQDIDFDYQQLVVRDTKSQIDWNRFAVCQQ